MDSRQEVAVPPRSPIGYNPPCPGRASPPGCGSSPISHRLQSPGQFLASADRCGSSPISHRLQCRTGCTLAQHRCGSSPISHRLQYVMGWRPSSRGCGSSPISHRLQLMVAVIPLRFSLRFLPDLPSATIAGSFGTLTPRVAVPPRSPIGYNQALAIFIPRTVAVPPRSPIGYNQVVGG